MKVWKIVSGILSIAISAFVTFQSFFAGAYNLLTGNGQSSGTAGVLVAVLLLAGGIVALVTHKGSLGGDIALAILYGLGALIGFLSAGSYTDLYFWSLWCLLCAFLALIDLALLWRRGESKPEVSVSARSPATVQHGPATFEDVILERDPVRRGAVIDALPEQHAKSYLKQTLNVLLPRAEGPNSETDGLIRTLLIILALLGVFVVVILAVGIFLSLD